MYDLFVHGTFFCVRVWICIASAECLNLSDPMSKLNTKLCKIVIALRRLLFSRQYVEGTRSQAPYTVCPGSSDPT